MATDKVYRPNSSMLYYDATVNLSDLTWSERVNCFTASKTMTSLFNTTNIVTAIIVSYSGIPVFVMLDGNNVIFTQFASSTPSGSITVRGINWNIN